MKLTAASVIIVGLIVAGCSTTGRAPQVGRSGFDNARTVTIEPHANTSTRVTATGLGAHWSAAWQDQVILEVAVFNLATGITNAELNIDGNKTTLERNGDVTDIDRTGDVIISTNSFKTNLATVEKILKSKRTWLRVGTPTGTLEDAVIDGPTDSKAFHALERFMAAVKASD
jgi:hypothetical protein